MPMKTAPASKAGMSPSIALTRAGSANTATMIPMRMSQKRLNACPEVRRCVSWVLLSQWNLPVAGHDPRAYRDIQCYATFRLVAIRGQPA